MKKIAQGIVSKIPNCVVVCSAAPAAAAFKFIVPLITKTTIIGIIAKIADIAGEIKNKISTSFIPAQ
jgi:hypothetical protein